jgi:hypothetical protein
VLSSADHYRHLILVPKVQLSESTEKDERQNHKHTITIITVITQFMFRQWNNCMNPHISWEDRSHSATHKTPHLKVLCCVHMMPPLHPTSTHIKLSKSPKPYSSDLLSLDLSITYLQCSTPKPCLQDPFYTYYHHIYACLSSGFSCIPNPSDACYMPHPSFFWIWSPTTMTAGISTKHGLLHATVWHLWQMSITSTAIFKHKHF